jgi:hypothetical protein
MAKPYNYAVIEGDRLVATSTRIANARKHRTGVAGRRIIRLQGDGTRIALRAYGDSSTYHITGVEVT